MPFEVLATSPLAADSADHLHPFGTAQDNSRNHRFNDKLYALYPGKKLRILDIGCAGGGFVADCVADGHEAIGIEGSDYSRARARAEWATIPERLFVADASKQFTIYENGDGEAFVSTDGGEQQTIKTHWRRRTFFDCITGWELLEHLAEADLPGFFANVRNHLASGGRFIASIALFPAPPHHVTIKPREWWMELLEREGFINDPTLVDYFGADWIRGDGNEPGRRFHVVMGCR